MEAQDGANKGKKGLGVGSHVMSNPKNMAAGSHWEGKKMSFDDTGGQSSEAGFIHSHSFVGSLRSIRYSIRSIRYSIR